MSIFGKQKVVIHPVTSFFLLQNFETQLKIVNQTKTSRCRPFKHTDSLIKFWFEKNPLFFGLQMQRIDRVAIGQRKGITVRFRGSGRLTCKWQMTSDPRETRGSGAPRPRPGRALCRTAGRSADRPAPPLGSPELQQLQLHGLLIRTVHTEIGICTMKISYCRCISSAVSISCITSITFQLHVCAWYLVFWFFEKKKIYRINWE